MPELPVLVPRGPGAITSAGSPPGGAPLATIAYDDLCIDVELSELAEAGTDAIARIAPAARCHPSPPVDFGGIVGPDPQTPERLRGNPSHPEAWWTTPFQAPELYAAVLGDALCFGGLPVGPHKTGHLLLAQGNLTVPDSYFVRSTRRSLPTDLVERLGAEPVRGADLAEWKPGLYYFAGAAWNHFGHFLTEGLSRWWLLARLAPSVRAELRFVLYDERPLARWQLDCLEALGVGAEQLVYLTEPQRFERLIVPAAAYNLHCAAAPPQAEVWEHIGRAFDRGSGPERVYLSRSRYTYNRTLVNEAEVERRFRARGFTVLHPQELGIAEQVAAVRHASLIAGSAGSAMYLSAFARPGARRLIISPRNFTFRDDQLISHLREGQLAYILCPRGARHVHPRRADYHVDLEILDTALDHWVAAGEDLQLH
jgi:hypothetical protein